MKPPNKYSTLRKVLKLYHLLQPYELTHQIHHIDLHSEMNLNLIYIKQKIDEAISTLPLQQRKLIILQFIMDIPAEKIQSMLGVGYRTEIYRKSEPALNSMMEHMGTDFFTRFGETT